MTIAANLGTLFIYKYLDFAIANLNVLARVCHLPEIPLAHIALPIGISFYCFQALSYTIDVYRREVSAQRTSAT